MWTGIKAMMGNAMLDVSFAYCRLESTLSA